MKITVLDRATLGSDVPLDMLNGLGEITVYDSTTPEDLDCRIADSEAIILNKVRITKDVLTRARKLRLICVTATGYDNIDLDAARDLGVAVTNVPGYSTDSVALFTVATVLALVTHIKEYNQFVTSGSYSASGVANRLEPVYHELRGMTWGIVGYGNIGRAVAKVAEAFGARILVNKRTPIDGVRCVGIDELCTASDIITLHCPLNSDTRGLVGERELAMMKSSAVLVNEARGAVVDPEAVAKAIEAGKIGAFGADVYEAEPMKPDHPFARIMHLQNVLLTPHSAWGAYEARLRCLEIVADNIRAFIDKEILNRVDI